MHVEECVCVRMCTYLCVRVHIWCTCRNWGEGEEEKGVTGLEPVTNMRRQNRLVLHQIVYGGTGMYTSWDIWAWGLCGCKQRGYWLLTQQWFWDWYIDKVFSVAVYEVCCTGTSSFILVHNCTSNMHVKLSVYVHVYPCNLTRYLPPLSFSLTLSLCLSVPPPPPS